MVKIQIAEIDENFLRWHDLASGFFSVIVILEFMPDSKDQKSKIVYSMQSIHN